MKRQPFEEVACCVCGGTEHTVKYSALPQDDVDPAALFKSSGDAPSRDRIVQCSQCGLVYVSPRLKPEHIVRGYSEGEDPRFVSQAHGRELTFARALRRIMHHAKRPGRVLDIGTAGGSFLAVAKRGGWDVDGIEPSRWLCRWAKNHYGLDVRPGTLEEHHFPPESFDLVTLWDVLEHMPQPEETLAACERLLKPGGLLVVNFPDIGSTPARLMGRRWVFLLAVHLWFFNHRTMQRLLEAKGFRVIAMKRHWQSLALGYLASRFEPYSGRVAALATSAVSALKLSDIQLPYWLGQTFVLAEKVR